MKIVIIPDSFKGTLSSVEICGVVSKAVKSVRSDCEVVEIPIADGGEGSVDAFLYSAGSSGYKAEKIFIDAHDLYLNKVSAGIGIIGDTAVIEVAAVIGLDEKRKDVMHASSLGVGELIDYALDLKVKEMILCLGGSGSNDCGIGMAYALGARFYGDKGEITSLNGESLGDIREIHLDNLDKRIKNCRFRTACDVTNPLYGKNGAAYVFAPQKGADENMVRTLDCNLKKFADCVKRCSGADISKISGGGAAGGLGAASVFFLGASLESGINLLLDKIDYEQKVKDADLIITGEGCIDSQSLSGKVISGILSRSQGKKIIALCGKRGNGWKDFKDRGIDVVCINPTDQPLNISMQKETARLNLYKTVESLDLIKMF